MQEGDEVEVAADEGAEWRGVEGEIGGEGGGGEIAGGEVSIPLSAALVVVG